ncbi:hypothetical protein GCM10007358_02040 [Phocicoccus schoeneichii]|uniref:Uncharacterized protein n=1 Tax=Phocicoccus schoeneichii TaxID=1812261 RepID=A0A6V7RJR5_9BACL|nr:hypothetical protein [Jeotgalicoccus schoeneichii]GGH47257.1 hypothetical protein GCM10007358_02040 [Jeotgalicoccus schoeneichii]CAD2077621.1 hypothetical protein JEOSCH030_01349 [Jeotgalicoccus schoeneichii]
MLQYTLINIKPNMKQNSLTQQVIEAINKEEQKGRSFVQVVKLTEQETPQILIISKTNS